MTSNSSEPTATDSTHRRRFLQTAAATGAAAWTIPALSSAASAAAASPPPLGDSRNLARDGVATMSSLYTPAGGVPVNGAQKGNDGDTDSYWTGTAANSLFHTETGAAQWWQVDLPGPAMISEVRIHNRSDCCTYRAQSVTLTIDGTPHGVFAETVPGDPGYPAWDDPEAMTTLTLPVPVLGQTVRVTNGRSDYFHLAEVEVIGAPVI